MVRPSVNGWSCASSGEVCSLASSSVPASVEISIAPMLIQYGGMRSDGAKRKAFPLAGAMVRP